VGDLRTVAGTLSIAEASRLQHPETTRSYEAGLDVVADRVGIDATSAIDVTGRGYEGGRETDEPGMTVGNVPAPEPRHGGSHGGLGGRDPVGSGGPAPTYGSLVDPDTLGGGGRGDLPRDRGERRRGRRLLQRRRARHDRARRAPSWRRRRAALPDAFRRVHGRASRFGAALCAPSPTGVGEGALARGAAPS